MIIKKTKYVLILIFVLSIAVTLFFIAADRKNKKVFSIDYLKRGVSVKIDNAYMVQDKGNKKEWEFSTDSAEVNRIDDITSLTNVKMNIYPEKNDPFNIYAETGKVKNKERDLEMSGNVTINNKYYTLSTQTLHWHSSKKEIKTDGFVRVKGEKITISGVGLVIDLPNKTLEIKDKVNAVFEIN